jgi:hypothetical protein
MDLLYAVDKMVLESFNGIHYPGKGDVGRGRLDLICCTLFIIAVFTPGLTGVGIYHIYRVHATLHGLVCI